MWKCYLLLRTSIALTSNSQGIKMVHKVNPFNKWSIQASSVAAPQSTKSSTQGNQPA